MSELPNPEVSDLIFASKVRHTPVFGQDGERIGHVEDLAVEKKAGRVAYAILSFGGFLGLGERYHPLPWSVLTYDTQLGGYVVPLDKGQLKDAPSYDLAELGDLGEGERYREAIFAYYGPFGATPYWR
ncbi:MAG: PRC-barrel domain-containing protein [Caulobacteraceae bacterium]|nr:PRC-barrel domain-containing protein [Caulobacteraceae bacterium]